MCSLTGVLSKTEKNTSVWPATSSDSPPAPVIVTPGAGRSLRLSLLAMSSQAIEQEAQLSSVIVSLLVLPVLAADILAMSFLSLSEDLRELMV